MLIEQNDFERSHHLFWQFCYRLFQRTGKNLPYPNAHRECIECLRGVMLDGAQMQVNLNVKKQMLPSLANMRRCLYPKTRLKYPTEFFRNPEMDIFCMYVYGEMACIFLGGCFDSTTSGFF